MVAPEMAPEPAGPLWQYPVRLSPSSAVTVDVFSAPQALWSVLRDAANDKSQPPQRREGEGEDEAAFKLRQRREVTKALAGLFTRASRVVPGGLTMRSVTAITYPTPNGAHTMSIDAVRAALVAANRAYVTDLLPDDADPTELFAGYGYEDLDEMRCALVAVADLVSRNVFDDSGRLTGLARRDMRRSYQSGLDPPAARQGGPKAGGQGGSMAGGQGGPKGGAEPPPAPLKADTQRNLRALLLDLCQTTWPFTPPHKSAVVTVESDPDQPRHKPQYRAAVGLPAANRVFQGPWQPTKRDAENAASELALTFLTHYKKKK